MMTIANASQVGASGLPRALRTAQEAIHLPDVQEMLRRLSEHNLGIFMPHMHDHDTGEFQPLPADVTQVESGLNVSFQPAADIAHQTDRFLPVGWLWRAGTVIPGAACEMVCEEGQGDPKRPTKHKM
jgi:hypothetical protein